MVQASADVLGFKRILDFDEGQPRHGRIPSRPLVCEATPRPNRRGPDWCKLRSRDGWTQCQSSRREEVLAPDPCAAPAIPRTLPSALRHSRASRFPCPRASPASSRSSLAKFLPRVSGILLRLTRCHSYLKAGGIRPIPLPTHLPSRSGIEIARNESFVRSADAWPA